MMGWKKSGSNADFPIGASMTDDWEPASEKRGPTKGGRMDFGSCLVLCQADESSVWWDFVPCIDLLRVDGKAEHLVTVSSSCLLLKLHFVF